MSPCAGRRCHSVVAGAVTPPTGLGRRRRPTGLGRRRGGRSGPQDSVVGGGPQLSGRQIRRPEGDGASKPGRAPGRHRETSQVLPAGGRRPRSRPGGRGGSLGGCGAPGDEPARRRPVRVARPVLGGAGARYDRPAGDAGARRWGRWTPAARKRTARMPRAARRRSRATLPHPALRTPAPYRRRRAPVLRRSASAGGGMRSVGGTRVRKATAAVGRNWVLAHPPRSRNVRIPLYAEAYACSRCNRSCIGGVRGVQRRRERGWRRGVRGAQRRRERGATAA